MSGDGPVAMDDGRKDEGIDGDRIRQSAVDADLYPTQYQDAGVMVAYFGCRLLFESSQLRLVGSESFVVACLRSCKQ